VFVWHKIRSAWRRVVRKQLVPAETRSAKTRYVIDRGPS
jgi:hypothetical protein